MDKRMLKEVLSLPSVYGNEQLVRNYIQNFAVDNNITYFQDAKGNIYLTKGSEKMTGGEYYPCVVSHMDTVHKNHTSLIKKRERLEIKESEGILTAVNPHTGLQTGIGGDDKCGVFVCLSMFEHFDVLKGAFFVEEEIGMLGSKHADPEFFKNVGYAIQFDAPSDNWISEISSGVKLFDKKFKDKITGLLSEGGYTKFSIDPFTDVNQLAQKFDFNCLNLGCGYYEQHRDTEYVVIKEVENSLKMGKNLIDYLGIKDYIRDKNTKKELLTEKQHPYDNISIGNYDLKFYDEHDENANKIVDVVFDMIDEGCSKEDIKFEIGEMLYNNGMV
jgi:putative aminopeptidase FrvX